MLTTDTSTHRIRERFGDLLRRYRAGTRLTQGELAARVGVIARSIQDWRQASIDPVLSDCRRSSQLCELDRFRQVLDSASVVGGA